MTVLLATDGSAHADAAAEHAIEVAATRDSSLELISVLETRTAYDNAIVEPDQVRANLREEAQDTLTTLAERAREQGLTCETTVAEGVPADEIVERAEAVDAETIVLGARGRSSFKTVLLGSVAESVLDRAVPSVILVRGSAH